MKVRMIASSLLVVPLLFSIACGNTDDDEPAVVPDPPRATAIAGEGQASTILIGARAMEFLTSVCEVGDDGFTVRGSGTSDGQDFTVEIDGNAAAQDMNVRVAVTTPEDAEGEDLPAGSQDVTWLSTGSPSSVEVEDDEIAGEIDVVEEEPEADTPPVAAVIAVDCSS
ncbi:MAG: hypothetical protein AB7K36_31700 [Chloroflexota bacterium]